MEETHKEVRGNKLLPASLTGIGSGVVAFILSSIVTKAENPTKSIIMSVLTGILVFSGLAAVFYYSMYRTATRSLQSLKEQTTAERLDEWENSSCLGPILESEVSAAKEAHQQISVLMVDLDHFREISNTCGKAASEQVISIFLQAVLKCLRQTDIIARYGGDEFIVILPGTDMDTARSLGDKIRTEVSETHIPPIDGVVISSIHCSIGISNYPVLCENGETLIRASDVALYLAKRSGRNCTRVYAGEPATAKA